MSRPVSIEVPEPFCIRSTVLRTGFSDQDLSYNIFLQSALTNMSISSYATGSLNNPSMHRNVARQVMAMPAKRVNIEPEGPYMEKWWPAKERQKTSNLEFEEVIQNLMDTRRIFANDCIRTPIGKNGLTQLCRIIETFHPRGHASKGLSTSFRLWLRLGHRG